MLRLRICTVVRRPRGVVSRTREGLSPLPPAPGEVERVRVIVAQTLLRGPHFTVSPVALGQSAVAFEKAAVASRGRSASAGWQMLGALVHPAEVVTPDECVSVAGLCDLVLASACGDFECAEH